MKGRTVCLYNLTNLTMQKNILDKNGGKYLLVYVCPSASEVSSILGMELGNVAESAKEKPVVSDPVSGKRYVYGIRGIQELFNVSHPTAQKYKDGIIKDAVFQSGRKIVVDVDKALELFNSRNGR